MEQTSRVKFWVVSFLSLAVMGGVAFGVYSAVRSPLFLVRVVEVQGVDEQATGNVLDAQEATRLAAIPLGKVNLFELDLSVIEKRLLKHPWIKAVRLEKRFPQTVAVNVTLKEPKAIAQLEGGVLSYVDPDGHPFGKVDTSLAQDLPLLEGLGPSLKRGDRTQISSALQILEAWGRAGLDQDALLSSITYEEERGYRGLVSYGAQGRPLKRLRVDFGHEIDSDLDSQFARLKQVIRYLSENGLTARQILTDTSKKIVVKIARGS